MGFSLDISVPADTVFVQGLLSFFSPCVLPLLPPYLGYLSGGAGLGAEDGRARHPRLRTMCNTFFFVLGISFAFLEENGYTYPVVMDPEGTLMAEYFITAFPTTFMIDPDGNIYGYVPGAMTEEIMQSIIDQTIRGTEAES